MALNSELEQKIEALINLNKYLNIYFKKTLSEIAKKGNSWNNKLEEMRFIKGLFLQIEEKYKITSSFYDGKKSDNKEKDKKLYVYISEKIKLSGVINKNLEKNLLNQITKFDYLITVGFEAINFAKKNNINSILSFDKNLIDNAEKIQTVILQMFISKQVSEVIFVFHSNKLINNQVSILPIKKFAIKQWDQDTKTIDLQNYKIFPNLNFFVEKMGIIFTNNVIAGLLSEAELFILKHRLSKLQNNINEINDRIEKVKRTINKIKGDLINSEILLVSQTSNDENDG